MGSVGWLAGMPVCEALAYVEQHRAVFDVVHVKYNDEVQKGSLFFFSFLVLDFCPFCHSHILSCHSRYSFLIF
jgi:hypothetical protein